MHLLQAALIMSSLLAASLLAQTIQTITAETSACNAWQQQEQLWLLANCSVNLTIAVAVAASSSRDVFQWLPAKLRLIQWEPQTKPLLSDLLLRTTCSDLWEFAALECTFRPSSYWPLAGLEVGKSVC